MAIANQIRKNNVIRYNGDMCLVLECITRTPPNLRAFVQIELRSLTTGRSMPVRCSTSENLDLCDAVTRKLLFSYENQGQYVFTDPVTYDTYELMEDMVKGMKEFLVAEQPYDVLFVDEAAVLINLPANVQLKVVEAAEAVRGNTSSNATKQVKMETGLMVDVPLFIKEGEILKISTENKSYLGRA